MKKQIEIKQAKAKGKEMIGKVVSTKMTHTVIVAVTRIKKHPVYKKAMQRTRRFPAHNELSDITVGNSVRIRETKPISKTKHFIVIEKIG